MGFRVLGFWVLGFWGFGFWVWGEFRELWRVQVGGVLWVQCLGGVYGG